VKLHRPVRLLHPRYPIYIAPKPNDLYVIGATELESEDESPMSVRSALELLSAAHSLHPAFGEARVLELNVQRRPTAPTICRRFASTSRRAWCASTVCIGMAG
jgi:glycine oxidase